MKPSLIFSLSLRDTCQQTLILFIFLLIGHLLQVPGSPSLELVRVHRVLRELWRETEMFVPHTVHSPVVIMILHLVNSNLPQNTFFSSLELWILRVYSACSSVYCLFLITVSSIFCYFGSSLSIFLPAAMPLALREFRGELGDFYGDLSAFGGCCYGDPRCY